MDDDRRNFKRHQTPNLKSNVSDGNSAFLVVVEDLSQTGVGLSQIPTGFDETVKKCLAVINTPHNDFKLNLNPRWVEVSGKGKHKKIGFEITDPPPEWIEFVEALNEDLGKKNREDNKRMKAVGLMTVLFDGKSTYVCMVEEISENGLRLAQIPTDFDDTTGECTAVIHSPAGELNISLLPCWVKSTNKGMYKSVGFQIQNPPADWSGFIKNLENEAGDLSFFLLKEDEED